MAIEKLKRHKSRGTDQIPAELIQTRVRKICSKIYKLVICVWIKEELNEQWNDLNFASI